MKIVVLDGFTLNPGDLSWQSLQGLGETVIYDRTMMSETSDRIADADIVLTNKVVLTEKLIANATRLKYIGVIATGYNVVDIVAASRRKITVTNVPAYGTASVAQLTFAIILELITNVSGYAQSAANGDWTRCRDFSYQIHPMFELHDKTLGIIGLGRIGQAVATIALAFNMKVIASHKHPERDAMKGVQFVDEETCFRSADFVSLHCPLNEENKYFVNHGLLILMKPTSFLINTSRGDLINEHDLAEALNSRQIAGAGLDVLSTEPPNKDNPLLHARNSLVTPHIAWATYEARSRLLSEVVKNVDAFIKGAPVNVVS
jgi:glycerate dehydrogenase